MSQIHAASNSLHEIMSPGERLNSSFPYYLNDDRKNTILAFCVGIFVVFFHHIYKPQNNYGIELTFLQRVLFGGVTFAVMYLNIVLLPKFLPKYIDPVQWTVKKYILHVLWTCFIIACINTIIDKFFICPQLPLITVIVHICTQVALTGIIPITIMSLLFRNNLLQDNLNSAINANLELDKIQTLKNDVSRNDGVTIFSETSETLTFNLPDLLFIEADDNYSTVVWKNGHGIEKKLLRVNLKSIESQLNNSFTLRCHRSYIVNVHAISNITGNTNGYKLKILDSDFSIPVSRPKGKEVIEKISQLRNMMELY
jgi:DNA-binding LytR/AlgR family response regulator